MVQFAQYMKIKIVKLYIFVYNRAVIRTAREMAFRGEIYYGPYFTEEL